VVSACGGSDSGGNTTVTEASDTAARSDAGRTTVTSDDVVVTLEVPEGAVPAGTEIEIRTGNVPAELAEISDATAYSFDLEPSGLEFASPATITFRLAASGELGTPLASLVITDAEGIASLLSTVTVREGDEIQISALVEHFSQAHMLVRDMETILTPELLSMEVGESDASEVQERHVLLDSPFVGYTLEADGEKYEARVLPVAAGYISVGGSGYSAGNLFVDSPISALVTCLNETDGVIENAYEVVLTQPPWNILVDFLSQLLVDETSGDEIRLLGDVECVAPSASTATTGPSAGSPTGSDEVGDTEANTGEQVKEGEGEPAGDIRNVRHVLGDAGEQCFVVDVVGDGEEVATAGADIDWYDILFEVVDFDGGKWRANVAYFDLTPTDRGVYLGPPEPGQQKLEGATVTAAWDDSDTLRSCVDGGEKSLAVATFKVSIGVSTSNGTFWDYAEGIAEG